MYYRDDVTNYERDILNRLPIHPCNLDGQFIQDMVVNGFARMNFRTGNLEITERGRNAHPTK